MFLDSARFSYDVQASSSPLRAVGAAVLTAVAGALTRLRLRVGRQDEAQEDPHSGS